MKLCLARSLKLVAQLIAFCVLHFMPFDNRLRVMRVLAFAVCLSTCESQQARATASGIDTPSGVSILPLAVEGIEGMDLVALSSSGPAYVGIGTTNPAWKLEVSGNNLAAPSSATIAAQGFQSSLSVINQAQTANWYLGIDDANSNALYIGPGYSAQQGTAPAIAINYGGYVGIGTSTPIGNLAIDNNAHNASLCLNGTCETSLAAVSVPSVYSATGGGGTATALCPAGKHATGGGGGCSGDAQGQLATEIYSNYPIGNPPHGWYVACDDNWGYPPPTTVAYVICQ